MYINIMIIENTTLYNGDAENILKSIEDNSVDCVVTSPPYDNLRSYMGVGDTWNHDKFCAIAKELYRVVKPGGVVVWVVNDKTEKGSETGTSFRQALHFIDRERKHERICPKASRQSEQDAETTLSSTLRGGNWKAAAETESDDNLPAGKCSGGLISFPQVTPGKVRDNM
jgi:ubiquinone/menaquinone biosynthesis C-methylase UbiE